MTKQKQKEFWYSVHNGGDGSAYPNFFESEDLAEYDQSIMVEGWGEPCVGSFNEKDIKSKEWYYFYLLFNSPNKLKDFVNQFYPLKTLPKFEVSILDKSYYAMTLNGNLIYKHFGWEDGQNITSKDALNRLRKAIESIARDLSL